MGGPSGQRDGGSKFTIPLKPSTFRRRTDGWTTSVSATEENFATTRYVCALAVHPVTTAPRRVCHACLPCVHGTSQTQTKGMASMGAWSTPRLKRISCQDGYVGRLKSINLNTVRTRLQWGRCGRDADRTPTRRRRPTRHRAINCRARLSLTCRPNETDPPAKRDPTEGDKHETTYRIRHPRRRVLVQEAYGRHGRDPA